MLYLLDKGDNWSTLSPDMTYIHYEDGTTEPLTPAHLMVEFGKCKGQKLSEISDIWYLNFLKKMAVDKGLLFAVSCVSIRILELN